MENHESRSVPPPGAHDTAALSQTTHRFEEVGDTDFPIVRRGGYDRAAVDAYVERMEQLVAEMDAAATNPGEAVRQALDRVGEETAGILRHAQETAASMTSRSEAEARERLAGAERRAREREDESEREAERLKTQAEDDVRRLDADNDRLWEERQRLIDETRKLSASLRRVAEEADQLFPPEPLGARLDGPEEDQEQDVGVEDGDWVEGYSEAQGEGDPIPEPPPDDIVRTDEGPEPGAGRA